MNTGIELLPYSFDLLYDIKTMEQVEMVCRGELNWATPAELADAFINNDMEIPKCVVDAVDEQRRYARKVLIKSGNFNKPNDSITVLKDTFREWVSIIESNGDSTKLLTDMKKYLDKI